MKIEVGTVFNDCHKHYPTTYTIVDIHTTYNTKGEVVKKVCICSFDFGQGCAGNTELAFEKVEMYVADMNGKKV